MSLQGRLTWLLGVFAIYALLATFGTIYAIRLHIDDAITSLQRSLDDATWIARVRLEAREQQLRLREVIEGSREADEAYHVRREGFFEELRQIARFALPASGDAIADDALELGAQLRQAGDRCLALVRDGERDKARAILHDDAGERLLPALEQKLRDARAMLGDSRGQAVDELVATNTQVLVLSLVIGVLGTALVTVGASLVHRWVIAPLRRFHVATQEFGRGNLSFRLGWRPNDELGALGQALDLMAERLAAARADLQVSEAKHRSLFTNLRDAAIICDAQGHLIECHDGETDLLGKESEACAGRRLLDVWPHWHDTGVDWATLPARVLDENARVRVSDLLLTRGSGAPTTIVDLIAYPIEFDRMRHVAIVLRDVTLRKQAEDALRKSEQRYRLLFERDLAGIYRTRLDGTILDCNAAMASMLGYESPEELIAHHAPDLYLENAEREAFLKRLKQAKVMSNSELRLRRKDGTPIDILENVILLPDNEGELTVIQGTVVNITERKQAEQALRKSERRYRDLADELRRVMQRLQTVREEERARIARELHDELGQVLTVLNMDLHWLKGRPWKEPEVTQGRIASMCELVDTTLRTVRRICADLRPSVLDDFGLCAAIEWQTREFQIRTGLSCRATLPSTELTLAPEQTTAVFRIFQESLTNVARHARATEVNVTLAVHSDTLVLKVADNGIGIGTTERDGRQSVGLVGMRERALRWGGQVDVAGQPGQGTRVTLHMPIEHDGAESRS